MTTVLLTGASSGLGLRAAHRFRALGVEVILVGRDADRTRHLAGVLDAPYHVADFTSLADVHRLADALLTSTPRIDVLASNAGGIAPSGLTADGIESTLQVNAIAPWLLMVRLSSALAYGRILATSSRSHRGATIDIDRVGDLALDTGDLSAHRRYARAKLAGGVLLREFARRHPGVDVGDFHPGIMATDFGRYMGWRGAVLKVITAPVLDSADDGAARLVTLALRQSALDAGYFVEDRPGDGSPQLADASLGAALWNLADQLTRHPTSQGE